jgi:hypothetical protein
MARDLARNGIQEAVEGTRRLPDYGTYVIIIINRAHFLIYL